MILSAQAHIDLEEQSVPYLGLIVMAVWIIALIDVICSDEHQVRNLPKTLWLIVVIILPLVGSLLWLVVGRPQNAGGSWGGSPRSRFPEYERPGRHMAQSSETDEEFLRRCRERAEQQRRIAKEQQRQRDENN